MDNTRMHNSFSVIFRLSPQCRKDQEQHYCGRGLTLKVTFDIKHFIDDEFNLGECFMIGFDFNELSHKKEKMKTRAS